MKHFVLLIALAYFSFHAAHAQTELRVVYTYDKKTFGKILEDFSKSSGIRIKTEFKEQNDLKSYIMTAMELNTAPDAIFMPADHVGLHEFIKYSEVDPKLFKAEIPERIWGSGFSDGKLYGAPIIQGNHLMLFYNKKLVKEPARDWQTMLAHKTELEAKGLSPITWSYGESYWFLPFLGAYGGWPITNGKVDLNTPAMATALDFYRNLFIKELPYATCSYQCTIDVFKAGKVAYTINGDWIGKEFYSVFGEDLGVSAIPTADGRKMLPTFSTHVMAFPNNSLSGANRSALIKLVDYLQSPPVQREIWDSGSIIPVEPTAFDYAQKNAKGYLKQTLELMDDTKPLPADQIMTFIWDAVGKGFIRHREGALDGPGAARYMQQLAERHIRNAQRQAEQAEMDATTP